MKIGVFIGRFQPFHQGHLTIIEQALQSVEQLFIIIGSIYRARTIKNPWNFEERSRLIKANLETHRPDLASKVSIMGVEDQMYNETVWNDSVRALILEHAPAKAEMVLIGHDKDESTYYLKTFPEWGRIELGNYNKLNATLMREQYFAGVDITTIQGLTSRTQKFLSDFTQLSEYHSLKQEFNYIKHYKASWSKAPFPPIHVTTDAVVICHQHILLVQRGHFPGKGLWALPGGFLEQKEWVWEGLIRELIEETCIDLSIEQLKSYLLKTHVFDNPGRSQVGRVITNAGLFEIPGNSLPEIKANDDAAAAKWVPLSELWQMSDQMHDDHYYIVKYLLGQY